MISIPYTFIAFALCLIIIFYKIGDLDDEIGWGIGLGTGVLALVLNHFFVGGCLGLLVYGVGGLVLLTGYKMLRAMPHESDPREGGNFRDREEP